MITRRQRVLVAGATGYLGGHDVYAGLTMGYPKYRYRRVAPLRPAAVRFFN